MAQPTRSKTLVAGDLLRGGTRSVSHLRSVTVSETDLRRAGAGDLLLLAALVCRPTHSLVDVRCEGFPVNLSGDAREVSYWMSFAGRVAGASGLGLLVYHAVHSTARLREYLDSGYWPLPFFPGGLRPVRWTLRAGAGRMGRRRRACAPTGASWWSTRASSSI